MEFSSDDVNLQSTVLLALATLQTLKKYSKKLRNPAGISCKEVVQYLKANYCWIDGDVESQVLTALLSCVKNGLVCVLNNHRYVLLGANSKNMISNCVTRISHGPKCSCLSTLECLFNIPRTCCVINSSEYVINKMKKPRKISQKRKSKPSPRGRKPKKGKTEENGKNEGKGKTGGKGKKRCAKSAKETIGTSDSSIAFGKPMSDSKCNYCLETHANPKLRKFCEDCFPVGKLNIVPDDKFSPRDEFTPEDVEKTCEHT